MTDPVNPWMTLIKGVVLYLIFEAAFFFSDFNPTILNLYQSPNMKWERFPFRAEPDTEYEALDVGILDTLFASHIISRPKDEDEFRVILLGDSATWGAPLSPSGALSSQINAMDLTCGSKHVVAYNLAYPEPSAIKDLAVLDRALQYEPDLVIWSVTLLSLTTRLTDEHPLFVTDEGAMYALTSKIPVLENTFPSQSIWKQFIHKQVSAYRTLRFQSYFPIELAAGRHQDDEIVEMGKDLSHDITYADMQPPILDKTEIATDLVNVFYEVAADVPVIVMNEPIVRVENAPNSDLRYNSYYPRWAYDQYREYMNAAAIENDWNYLDYWDLFPEEYFADTPLHLNREGNQQLAEKLAPAIAGVCN